VLQTVNNLVMIPTMDTFARLINRITGDSIRHISQYRHQYLQTYPISAKLRLLRFFHDMGLEILQLKNRPSIVKLWIVSSTQCGGSLAFTASYRGINTI